MAISSSITYVVPAEEELASIAGIYCNMPGEWRKGFTRDLTGSCEVVKELDRARLASAGDMLLGAYAQDCRFVGFVWFQQTASNMGIREGHLKALWVEPLYRERGIGSTLLVKVVEYARERCSYLSARVFYSNERMLRVVDKLGFQSGYVDVWLNLKGDEL